MNTTHATDPTDTTDSTVRRFDAICVIFDPHSTGDVPELAAQRRDQLERDMLGLSIGTEPEARSVHAHADIGLGLTPVVAIDIEEGHKGAPKEMASVLRTSAQFRPFRIEHTDGARAEIVSLVFANIAQTGRVRHPR